MRRPLDARTQQHISVEALTQHPLAGKLRAEPIEGGAVTVDDRDFMAYPGQSVGHRSPDPAAPHHNHPH